MEQIVFLVEGREYGKLKEVLSADPFERDSFPVAGYVLKESNAVGMKGGNYVVYFRHADASVISKLRERLSVLETRKELAGEEKEKTIALIEGEEDRAAAGLGSIFG